MRSVGIRELRQNASRLIGWVREQRESVDVTLRGRVVARLVPVPEAEEIEATIDAVWTDIDRLAAEIGASWPEGVSAADAVGDARRG